MTILRLTILLLFSVLAISVAAKGKDIIYSESDSLIYETYVKQFAGQKDTPFNELLINTARYFLGKPYVAATLETSDDEKLIINLREFDCTTLVENCIALALTIKSDNLSFENYCQNLASLRYRNGKVEGYNSRLHYTSDWIYENMKQGIIKDISPETGGKHIIKKIDFMTTHPHLYKHLKSNPENIKKLEKIETDINSRNSYIIIPVGSITESEKNIQDGDIIAFATSVSGLDYSHIGIAYWQTGKLHFIHASSRLKKVVIEEKTLSDYCRNSKSCTGISALRTNK